MRFKEWHSDVQHELLHSQIFHLDVCSMTERLSLFFLSLLYPQEILQCLICRTQNLQQSTMSPSNTLFFASVVIIIYYLSAPLLVAFLLFCLYVCLLFTARIARVKVLTQWGHYHYSLLILVHLFLGMLVLCDIYKVFVFSCLGRVHWKNNALQPTIDMAWLQPFNFKYPTLLCLAFQGCFPSRD